MQKISFRHGFVARYSQRPNQKHLGENCPGTNISSALHGGLATGNGLATGSILATGDFVACLLQRNLSTQFGFASARIRANVKRLCWGPQQPSAEVDLAETHLDETTSKRNALRGLPKSMPKIRLPKIPVPEILKAAALVLVWSTSVVPAIGHTTSDFLPLDFVGYHAPFGNEGLETYTEVWAEGDYAYLGSLASGVAIIDTSDANSLATASVFGSGVNNAFHDVRVDDGVGYFSTDGVGTFVIDLTMPETPAALSQITGSDGGFDNVTNAFVHGNHFFQVSAESAEIAVFNISSPAAPSFVTRINTGDSIGVNDLTIVGDRIYAAGLGGTSGQGAVYLYDAADIDTGSIPLVAEIETGINTSSAWPTLDASTLLVTHREVGGFLAAWDITNPQEPALIEDVDASDMGVSAFSTAQVVVHGDVAYVAWLQAGVQAIDLELLEETDTIFRVGAFSTSLASPLSGIEGNTSVFPLSPQEVYLADSRWGLYLVDATQVVPLPSIPADFNEDEVVDVADYIVWRNSFGQLVAAYSEGDADGDADVDGNDFLIWQRMYGDSVAGALALTAVPEPTSLALTMSLCLSTIIVHGSTQRRGS